MHLSLGIIIGRLVIVLQINQHVSAYNFVFVLVGI